MAIKTQKPKKSKLGTPPKIEEPKINNLSKHPSEKLVSISFLVPVEFKREYKLYATRKDTSMLEILKKSFELYKKQDY